MSINIRLILERFFLENFFLKTLYRLERKGKKPHNPLEFFVEMS